MFHRWSFASAPATAAAAAFAVAASLALGSPPALAQSSQVQELVNRIERLQQELSTLQGYVYRGGSGAPPAGARAPVPGGSAGADAGNPAAAARLSLRMSQMEAELGRLTGQNEEYGHAIRQMQSRLDKLVTDVDSRLAALEGRGGGGNAAGGAAAGPEGGAAALAEEAAAARAGSPPAAGAGPSPGTGAGQPQVLGQLRIDPATGQPLGGAPAAQSRPNAPRPLQQQAQPQQQQQAARPPETPQQLYDRAQGLLLKEQNVGEAERVLKEFLQKYPNHELASNAHYWLGRTYFVREDYQQAAFTFADGFQKYPKSDKAAANLLNLGMSLGRLGKNREACTAYQRLLQNFPDAEDAIKRRANSERQRSKCG